MNAGTYGFAPISSAHPQLSPNQQWMRLPKLQRLRAIAADVAIHSRTKSISRILWTARSARRKALRDASSLVTELRDWR